MPKTRRFLKFFGLCLAGHFFISGAAASSALHSLLEMPWILAALFGFLVAYIPLFGWVLTLYGIAKSWAFGWLAACFVFLAPIFLAGWFFRCAMRALRESAESETVIIDI